MGSCPKRMNAILIIVLLVLLAIFLFSVYQLFSYYSASQKSQEAYKGLQAIHTAPSIARSTNAQDTAPTEIHIPLTTVTNPNTGEAVEVLPELAEIYGINPDLVGWLTIPGTDVDHPVVQRKAEKDYYLHRNFYGNYDDRGCLYVQEECDVAMPSDNTTIYGHHMYDLSMFGQLLSYQRKDFWQEHQFLYFDTLTERHTYQVICVFSLSTSNGTGFPYHLFVEAASKEEFQTYLENCAAHQLYDTGLTAQHGDKLLSLSTCEYSHEGGRLVVVAKRID